MAGLLFRRNIGATPQAIAGIKIQTSAYGVPIPIVYGQARLAGNLLYENDFKSSTIRSGGKGGRPVTGYNYQAAIALGLCEGPIGGGPKPGIVNTWADKVPRLFTAMIADGYSLFIGTASQAPWGFVTTNHPAEAVGYQYTAYIVRSDWPLTGAATLANYSWEIQGFLQFGGATAIVDANPGDAIQDMLTSPQYGAGIDPASIAALTTFHDYCSAAGLFISATIDTQRPAMDYVREFLNSANSAIIWSAGLFKIIPYGDTALTANGATFTPNITALYDLADDDFIVNPGEDPIKVRRVTQADAFNNVIVEFESRAQNYNIETAEAKDQASIELTGLRPMPVVKMPWVKTAAIARAIAQLILQRQINLRNIYNFNLSWRHCLLEPMDIVSISDVQLGLVKKPVRVIEIAEDDTGMLSCVAEDFQAGTGAVQTYPTQIAAGAYPDQSGAPGNAT